MIKQSVQTHILQPTTAGQDRFRKGLFILSKRCISLSSIDLYMGAVCMSEY